MFNVWYVTFYLHVPYFFSSLYDDFYRATQNGQIGITLNSDWFEPLSLYRESDIDAAERVKQFFLGWFAHPIYKGDYPELMKVCFDTNLQYMQKIIL